MKKSFTLITPINLHYFSHSTSYLRLTECTRILQPVPVLQEFMSPRPSLNSKLWRKMLPNHINHHLLLKGSFVLFYKFKIQKFQWAETEHKAASPRLTLNRNLLFIVQVLTWGGFLYVFLLRGSCSYPPNATPMTENQIRVWNITEQYMCHGGIRNSLSGQ